MISLRENRRASILPKEAIKTILRYTDLKARRIVNNRMTLRRWIQRGFPKPVHLGPNSIGWFEVEVEAWLAMLAAERREGVFSASKRCAGKLAEREIAPDEVEKAEAEANESAGTNDSTGTV